MRTLRCFKSICTLLLGSWLWMYPLFAVEQPIDTLVLTKLKEQALSPAMLCSDEEYLRRTYLTLVGVIPPASEVKAFLADRSSHKHAQLIERLLGHRRFGVHWGVLWSDLLRERTTPSLQEGTIGGTYKIWIEEALNRNLPYDQFMSELVTATGSPDRVPAVNFYLRNGREVEETSNTISSVFMGTRLSCAQCHDHPFDRWTQQDFHGLTAFLGRTRIVTSGPATEAFRTRIGKTLNLDAATQLSVGAGVATATAYRAKLLPLVRLIQVKEVYEDRRGNYTIRDDDDPRISRKRIDPYFPWNPERKLDPEELWREGLARIMREDRQFAEVQANRIWAYIFGRGLVDPLDDFGPHNPPSHPELLAYLTDRFVASGFDNKALIREILNSKTYRRSSKPAAGRLDEKYHAHYRIRRLSAEQLFDSLKMASGQIESLDQTFEFGPLRTLFREVPLPLDQIESPLRRLLLGTETGWAGDTPTPARSGDFMQVFGQPERENCVFVRDAQGSLTQALHLLNGLYTNEAVRARGSKLVRRLLDARISGAVAANEFYLAVFSRLPSSAEREFAATMLPLGKTEYYEDLLWAMLNAREFLFIR